LERSDNICQKDEVCGEYGSYGSIIRVACNIELRALRIGKTAFDIPFHTYLSVTKYNAMGTIPRARLNIMSFTRTALCKPVKLSYRPGTLPNVLLGGLRCELSDSSLFAHFCCCSRYEENA
jgi:hypothetical protein